MGSAQSFPYNITKDRSSHFKNPIWGIHDGIHKLTNDAVSIFVFDSENTSKTQYEMALTFLENIRVIRHPLILQYIESFQDDKKIIIVTERIDPFTFPNRTSPNTESISLEIYQITKALNFLNKNCNKIHCNLDRNSVFIAKNGDLKLGGFEYTFIKGQMIPYHVIKHLELLFPDQLHRNISHLIQNGIIDAERIDCWNLAIFIFKCFHLRYKGINDLFTSTLISSIIGRDYEGLVCDIKERNSDKKRSIEEFLTSEFFGNDTVELMRKLEEIDLMKRKERIALISRLNKRMNNFGKGRKMYKILPVLLPLLSRESKNNKELLSLIIKIGVGVTNEEFNEMITPTLQKLYESDERSIRINLLNLLSQYIIKIDENILNDGIFKNYCKGMQDSFTLMRFNTVKNAPIIASKLAANKLNKLINLLNKMQCDVEAQIRGESIKAIKGIVKFIKEEERTEGIWKACRIALWDKNTDSVRGGLECLEENCHGFPLQFIALKALPCISAFTIHNDKRTRLMALKCIDSLVGILKNPPEIKNQNEIAKNSPSEPKRNENAIFSFVKNLLGEEKPKKMKSLDRIPPDYNKHKGKNTNLERKILKNNIHKENLQPEKHQKSDFHSINNRTETPFNFDEVNEERKLSEDKLMEWEDLMSIEIDSKNNKFEEKRCERNEKESEREELNQIDFLTDFDFFE